MLKRCSKCCELKSGDKFSRRSGTSDGFFGSCRQCRAAYAKLRTQKLMGKRIGKPMDHSAVKQCRTCGDRKRLDGFHTNNGNLDGLCNSCKDCANIRAKKYYGENRSRKNNDGYRAKQNARYSANPSAILERNFRYKEKNPEKFDFYQARQTLARSSGVSTKSIPNGIVEAKVAHVKVVRLLRGPGR